MNLNRNPINFLLFLIQQNYREQAINKIPVQQNGLQKMKSPDLGSRLSILNKLVINIIVTNIQNSKNLRGSLFCILRFYFLQKLVENTKQEQLYKFEGQRKQELSDILKKYQNQRIIVSQVLFITSISYNANMIINEYKMKQYTIIYFHYQIIYRFSIIILSNFRNLQQILEDPLDFNLFRLATQIRLFISKYSIQLSEKYINLFVQISFCKFSSLFHRYKK
ncbi:hypothetical protein pb186bvf_001313 [Paramecium bursaria]